MHSCATRPFRAGVEHRVVLVAAGPRRSSPPAIAVSVARRQPVRAHHPHVRPGDRQDAGRPVRRRRDRADPGRRSGRRVQRVVRAGTAPGARAPRPGPTPGPPPPCGMQNVLCRFRCETSAAEPARPGQPDQRVEVRAVDVHLAAGVVHRGADLGDVVLEHPVRGRVGDHQRGQPSRRARSILARRSSRSTSPSLVAGHHDHPHARPAPRWPRWCRARWTGSGRRRGRARRARGGRRGSPAARRTRPATRRSAAARPRRSR